MTRDPTRHAFTPEAVAHVRRLLTEEWDRDGALARAAAGRAAGPGASGTLDEHTIAVCGILAAGGTRADVVRFLHEEELALLGTAVVTPRQRGAVARAAWLAARGLDAGSAADDEA